MIREYIKQEKEQSPYILLVILRSLNDLFHVVLFFVNDGISCSLADLFHVCEEMNHEKQVIYFKFFMLGR